MSDKLCHMSAPTLTGHDELLLVRGENPMGFLYLGFRAGEGFSGGLMADVSRRPLAECAVAIDSALCAGDPAPFPMIRAEIPPHILTGAIFDPEGGAVHGYLPEQIEAVSRLINERLPEGATGLINRKVLGHDAPLIDWVNYLSCGDREARVQALRAVPLQTGSLLTDPDMKDLVDQRSHITPLVARKAGLKGQQMQIYARIEAQMATLLSRDLNGEPPLTREPIAKTGLINTPLLRMSADVLRELAYAAARVLRTDQVPRSPEDTVELLTYFSESNRIRKGVPLNDLILRKHLSRVTPSTSDEGAWGRACVQLQKKVPVQETTDYLGAVAKALMSGLIVHKMRDLGVVDFHRIGSVAKTLREKGEPEASDGEYMASYVRAIGEAEYRLGGTRRSLTGLIGEGHSMRSLRDAQVRWHHVHHTLGNEVMTSREPLEWAPLLGQVDLGPIRAVELTSSGALERQGRLERHCVGGYTGAVMGATSERASLIFSLEREGEILSTVEMRVLQSKWDKKNPSWEIVQNKAARNADPSPEALEAGDRLKGELATLSAREIRDYLTGIRSNATQIRDTLALVSTRMGADITNPDLPELALKAYAEVLPKTLSGLGVAQFQDALIAYAGADALAEIDRLAERVIKSLPAAEVDGDEPERLEMAS